MLANQHHLLTCFLALKTRLIVAVTMMTIMIMSTTTTIANDYGYGYHKPTNVTVINRQISLTTIPAADDTTVQAALDLQWQMITGMIPIPEPIRQRNLFYNHAFRQNIGNYIAQERQLSRATQTRVVTKTYTGYIKQGFRIESNGSVTFSH